MRITALESILVSSNEQTKTDEEQGMGSRRCIKKGKMFTPFSSVDLVKYHIFDTLKSKL